MQFLVIYIREAHAFDGAMPMGGGRSPIVEEPLTFGARKELAQKCLGALDMSPMTMLVDGIDNAVGTAYAAFPDRLFLVAKDGKIVLSGGKGPRGFEPNDLEDAIRVELGLEPVEHKAKARKR